MLTVLVNVAGKDTEAVIDALVNNAGRPAHSR